MRTRAVIGSLAATVALIAASAEADVSYDLSVRTLDGLGRGTVELEETITVSVRGDRKREEVRGTRTVVTRRGARYQKPGHALKLDLLDRGVRYEANLDAGTYVEESLDELRRRHEEEITAAERSLGVSADGSVPRLAVATERPEGRQTVHGRACQPVVLAAAREVALLPARGARPAGPGPSRFVMTVELCLALDAGSVAEARALDDRLRERLGLSGPLFERQLRIFDHRRDVFAVFELMSGVLEREQRRLGLPLRWQRTLVGPRRDQPEAVLFLQTGELTRVDPRPLDGAGFGPPAGLQLDPRRVIP
jgi:hypothetical protein